MRCGLGPSGYKMEYESSGMIRSEENAMCTEKQIKEESLWLERGYTEVKYESEESVLRNEEISSDFAMESSSSTVTCNSYEERYHNIEIKEEHWWEESVEVKPESEELDAPENEFPIELKACIAGNHAEKNAAIENIRSSPKFFQINRNELLLNRREKYRQVGAAKMVADCECKLHCFDRINDIERRRLLEHFQKLRYSNLQSAYLLNCLKVDELNHKKKETYLPSEHSSSLQYFVQTIEGEKVKVCETAFLNIHGLQNHTDIIENIAVVLKKANLNSPFHSFTIMSQKNATCYSNLQNAAHMRNPILLFKKRKPFLKVSRPLTWKKKRALALLLLHRLRLQQLGGMQE